MKKEKNVFISQKFEDCPIISFDLLGTIFNKPFLEKVDMFDLINIEIEKTLNLQNFNFGKIRILSENIANIKSEKEQIDLNDIYMVFKNLTKFSNDEIMEIEKIELCYEQKFYSVNEIGYNLYQKAIAMGKKIIFTSDTVLPRFFIEGLLDKFNFIKYENIFLSSELNYSKKTGSLFKHITEVMNCESKYIMHIGTNYEEDFIIPNNEKISTLPILSDQESFKNTYYYKKIWENEENDLVSTKIIKGLLANKFYKKQMTNNQKTAFYNSPERIGYFALGPILLGFNQWIIQKSQEDYIKKVYFSSNTGSFVEEAFKIISKHHAYSPMIVPVLVNKNQNFLVKHRNFSDITSDLYDSLKIEKERVTLKMYFLTKYNFDISKYQEILNKYDLSTHAIISIKENCNKLVLAIDEISNLILSENNKEKDKYRKYLNFIGLPNQEKSAIVSINDEFNSQFLISDVIEQKISGINLFTYNDYLEKIKRNKNSISGYLSNFEDFSDKFNLINILFKNYDYELTGIEIEDNMINPRFEQNTKEKELMVFIEKCQKEALEFVKDFELIYGKNLSSFYFSPKQLMKPLDYFLEEKEESDCLLNLLTKKENSNIEKKNKSFIDNIKDILIGEKNK